MSRDRTLEALWDRIVKTSKGKHELPPLGLVGEEIGNARKKLRLTTLQVSEKTRIPERYVIAVEAGDFASLPGKTFIFGFTRTICALLGLDADEYIAIIKSELFGNRTGEPSTPEPSRGRGAVMRRRGMGQNPRSPQP
jgi:cytoskeletal protein RodZ